MDSEVLFSAEQIRIPPELGDVLKEYTKQVIRVRPRDLLRFSANYFADLAGEPLPFPDIPLRRDAASRAAQITENTSQLEKLRSSGKLPLETIEAILERLSQKAVEGKLNRETFEEVLLKVFSDVRKTEVTEIPSGLCRIFDVFDSDGSGSIDVLEITAGFTSLFLGDRDERLRVAFRQMDSNGDGTITKKELLNFFRTFFKAEMRCIGIPLDDELWNSMVPDIVEMFNGADRDGSGSVSMEEFVKAVLSDEGSFFRQVYNSVASVSTESAEVSLDQTADMSEVLTEIGKSFESALQELSELQDCKVQ